MAARKAFVYPEEVLRELYGRSSVELGISEKRRDEAIAAAIFTCFRNHEYGTRFKLPADYKSIDHQQDARGIDIEVVELSGRTKKLQIKGIHIHRSIERRRLHRTSGGPRITGRRARKLVQQDSLELGRVMRGELKKIVQDYSGLILIIDVKADLATQTSLEIAIRKNARVVSNLKAKEVWFLRSMPVRMISRKRKVYCHSYQLLKVSPDKHTYGFSFAL